MVFIKLGCLFVCVSDSMFLKLLNVPEACFQYFHILSTLVMIAFLLWGQHVPATNCIPYTVKQCVGLIQIIAQIESGLSSRERRFSYQWLPTAHQWGAIQHSLQVSRKIQKERRHIKLLVTDSSFLVKINTQSDHKQAMSMDTGLPLIPFTAKFVCTTIAI